MYGQYSSAYTGNKTKREMVELAKRRHPGCDIVDAVKIANNTLKYGKINPGGRASGYTYIALHDTDIISFHKSGEVHISTGGYNTVTTRARLRDFAPGSYYTRGGVLHVNGVPFHREAFIAPDGKVTPDRGATHHETLRAHIDAYMAEWKKRGLPSREDAPEWLPNGAAP